MRFEDLPEIIEGLETVKDWLYFGSKPRWKMATSTAIYAYSLLAPFPCYPDQQPMLCQVPSHIVFEAIAASANSAAIVSSPVVLSGSVVIFTGGTTVASTGEQAQSYAGKEMLRKV